MGHYDATDRIPGNYELGVHSSVVKYTAEYRGSEKTDEFNQTVSAAIGIYSAVGFISLTISCVIAAFFPHIFSLADDLVPNGRAAVIITGITVAQSFVFNTFYGILMGLQRYDVFNKIGVIFAFFKNIMIVVFLTIGHDIIALALIHLITSLSSNLIVVYYCKKLVPVLKINLFTIPRSMYRIIFSYSSQSFFIRVSQKIVFQTDSFIIGFFVNLSAVTFFSIPGTLIEYMRRLVIAMTEIFVPVTSD